jgi:hypothetical protein
MKGFAYFSAGTKNQEPWLNVEELTEQKLLAALHSLAWIPEGEYLPFIEKAEVGDMILLKGMIALVRLRPQNDWEPLPNPGDK